MERHDFYGMLRENRICGSEHSQLVSKCQENGWLKVGGYDWQDDPFLEEYPYEFMRIDDIDALREHFERGNWAIRQGVVFDDLAFINQVNGGDEWWTLKRDGEEWVAFESTSFAYVIEAKGRAAFETLVRSMQLATPAQCKALDYYDKDASAKWAAERNPRTPELERPLAQRASDAREAASTRNGRSHVPRREAQAID